MDATHALGYTMLIAESTQEVMDIYREYHEHVVAILWQDRPETQVVCMQNLAVAAQQQQGCLFEWFASLPR